MGVAEVASDTTAGVGVDTGVGLGSSVEEVGAWAG